MTKIIMHGCNGKMGQMISQICREDETVEIVAGVDVSDQGKNEYPVFLSLKDCDASGDVLIDFSTAGAVEGVLSYCMEKDLPLVLCTTGLSESQLLKVEECSKKVPVLRSANMSLGINTLFGLLEQAVRALAPAGFDVEIVEKHHNQKLDAPSGTALALADAMNRVMDESYKYKFDRSKERAKRDAKEIGISAVRGGSIVGEHEVIFAGRDEVIEIKHTAYSRAIFGKGAVEAAKFLQGKAPGMYDMREVAGHE